MPFTRRNLKADLEDYGPNFGGAPDLEFRAATKALEVGDVDRIGHGAAAVSPPRVGSRRYARRRTRP